MVSVSECWSWSRTVGNLLRNILKLQPETVQWPQTVQWQPWSTDYME